MTPDEVLNLYTALKLHFTTAYDFHKYRGQLTKRLLSYENRPDHGYIFRLSRKYRHNELEGLIIANMLQNSATWPGLLCSEEGKKIYDDWLAFNQSLTYNVAAEVKELLATHYTFAELLRVKDGQHPELLKLYLAKKIHLETLVVLLSLTGLLEVWNKQISDSVVWPVIHTLIAKYTPFVKFDKDKLQEEIRKAYNTRSSF